MDSVRVDRWLCAARIFPSRSQASQACTGGHVRVNDLRVRPSHTVVVGDELRVKRGSRLLVLGIRALAEKRLSPPAARELYEDRTPAPPPEEAVRAPGSAAGRPTKRDRRLLRRLRGR